MTILCASVVFFAIEKDWMDKVAWGGGGLILVAVGVWGAWLATRTLKSIRKQVDAMALAERAWLIGRTRLFFSLVTTLIGYRQQRSNDSYDFKGTNPM